MRPTPTTLVAISGPVCAGKSTLADALVGVCGASVLTTRTLIARHLSRPPEGLSRSELQEAGEELDRQHGGAWVGEEIAEILEGGPRLVVVDAVRNGEQLAAARELAQTFHVHLSADETTLVERYAERASSNPQLEFPDFKSLLASPTEAQIEELGRGANLVVDTGREGKAQTMNAVLAGIG